jgi:hypothetical protein
MLKRLILILSCLCSNAAVAQEKTTVVPLAALYGNAKFNGKPVMTTGYLVKDSGVNALNLYPYKIDADNEDFTKAIQLNFPDDVQLDAMKGCLNTYVYVKGTFYMQTRKMPKQFSPVSRVSVLKRPKGDPSHQLCWKK